MGYQIATACFLAGSVIAWWFALRIIFGNLFGFLHWLPTAICCFAIPILIADRLAGTDQSHLTARYHVGWFCIALLINVAGGLRAWVRCRKKPTEAGL